MHAIETYGPDSLSNRGQEKLGLHLGLMTCGIGITHVN